MMKNRKQTLALLLLLSLLLVCFAGCATPTDPQGGTETDPESTPDTGETDPENPKGPGEDDSNNMQTVELYDTFAMIKSDIEKCDKLEFFVEYEEIYNEFKSSGQYDNSNWTDSVFIVIIYCTYETAINEDWYKQCSETDIKSLNAAFYNYYSTDLSKGNYANIFFSPGMHLMYYSPEDFNNDYAAIKALMDLDYVTEVSIVYKFPVPDDYILE